jgi:hypothetical protein
MQPEAGLGWAGEGGCRSYLGRIHFTWPSSGGVASTCPHLYPGAQAPRHDWHIRFCACSSDLGRPSQTGKMGRRRQTRGNERRRKGKHTRPCPTRPARATFVPLCLVGSEQRPSLIQRQHHGGACLVN